MAINLTLDSVNKDADGRVRFRFQGEEMEFRSTAEAAAFAQGRFTRDDLKAVAIALVLTRQPALGNTGIFAGKVLTVDLTAINWGSVA